MELPNVRKKGNFDHQIGHNFPYHQTNRTRDSKKVGRDADEDITNHMTILRKTLSRIKLRQTKFSGIQLEVL